MSTDYNNVNEHGYPQHGTCRAGDPMWLLAEGYAYCEQARTFTRYYLYRLTPPSGTSLIWGRYFTSNGTPMYMHCRDFRTMDEMVEAMHKDMERERQAGPTLLESPSYAEWLAGVS